MTEQLPNVALANTALLRVIGQGPRASLADLAAAADVSVSNINRKLTALEEAGIIAKTGAASHEVALTPQGERALLAVDVFAGAVDVVAEAVRSKPQSNPAQIDLDPHLIDPNPFQPRTTPDPVADAEMARSVADKGILQRILVRPVGQRYQQALGHRRVRGAIAAGILVPVEIRDLSDDDMAEIGVIENVQRADLHWMDEAEAYLMLANRGKSAAQIQQLVGAGGRKKRSIQEMIQFARELDDEAKARARLPEGEDARLTVDQARAMVGNKRPRPSLDLTPKLAATFLELLLAGDCAGGEPGDTIEAVLHQRPVGGPMITLSDRGLIKFKFQNGLPVVLIPITDVVAKYLAEVGYDDDPAEAVAKARVQVIGDLAAGVLAAESRWLTSELNPPESKIERETPAPGALDDDDEHGDLDDPELDDGGKFAFGEKPAQPAPAVTDEAALVLLELAHKIYAEPRPGEALPAAEVDAGYRLDPLSNQLVFERLIMFRMMGAVTAAALTPTAQQWLDSREIPRDGDGRPLIDDVALDYIQAADGRPAHGRYITPWLTVKPAAEQEASATAAEAAPDAQAEAAHAVRDPAAPPRDGFMQSILDVTREDAPQTTDFTPPAEPAPIPRAVLTRLMAAAREAQRLLASAPSRKLKEADVKPALGLLDAALGDAQSALDRQNPAAITALADEAEVEPAGELAPTELEPGAKTEAIE